MMVTYHSLVDLAGVVGPYDTDTFTTVMPRGSAARKHSRCLMTVID